MTRFETGMLILLCIWIVTAFAIAYYSHKVVGNKYKKFYPHPLVGFALDISRDPEFSPVERISGYISCGILYIPIMPIWFVAWCIYKIARYMMTLYVDTVKTSVVSTTQQVNTVQKDNSTSSEKKELDVYQMKEEVSESVSEADVTEETTEVEDEGILKEPDTVVDTESDN